MTLNPWKRIKQLMAENAELRELNKHLSESIMRRDDAVSAQYRVQLENMIHEVEALERRVGDAVYVDAEIDQLRRDLAQYKSRYNTVRRQRREMRKAIKHIALSCSKSASGTATRVSRQLLEAIQ